MDSSQISPGQTLEAFSSLGFSALGILLLALVLVALSAYVKIVTVLAVLRTGLGWNSLPGILITGIVALALSFFVMVPTLERASAAMEKVTADRTTDAAKAQALAAGAEEWRLFLARHASANDQQRFAELAAKIDGNNAEPAARESFRVLVPSFVVSQLRGAFSTALVVLLPLILIDLIVASGCAALSFNSVNPHLVALPLKLLLFVTVDGWTLITSNLIGSFAS
jgi:flagellar biosynthesis protein FliP